MQDATVLRPMRFLGKDRLPGDVIPAGELAQVSPPVLEANYSQGNLGDPARSDVVLDEDRVREILREFQDQQREEMQETIVEMQNNLRDSLTANLQEAINAGEVSSKPGTPRRRGRPPKQETK